MYLLFDIGGTNMRLGVSFDGKEINEIKRIPTPKDFEEGMSEFKRLADQLREGKNIEAIAGGIAGPLDKEHTMLVSSPHISSWTKKPFKKELEKMFTVPVYLENDSALVGLGEATRGAGKGYEIVAYIGVGTGIGGGRFVDGEIDRSSMGFEPGHQIIDFNGQDCPGLGCNGKGHLEGYVSGNALQHRFGKHPAEITDEKVWDELAQWLAIGLNNSIVHWSPDIVVLGGSMITGNPSIPMDAIQKYTKETLKIFPEPPPIKMSTLGDIGGLYGALELAKQQRFTAT